METVVVERMARYDDREKPVSKDLHTLASSLESCRVATGEKISPRCTRVLWRDLYAQCTTAASTWEHGYVAISAVSLLSFCATRQELSYSPPFSFHVPSRGEKDDRGGQGGKARDRDARDWPMGFFGAARGSPRGLASNLLRIHIQRDDNRSL